MLLIAQSMLSLIWRAGGSLQHSASSTPVGSGPPGGPPVRARPRVCFHTTPALRDRLGIPSVARSGSSADAVHSGQHAPAASRLRMPRHSLEKRRTSTSDSWNAAARAASISMTGKLTRKRIRTWMQDGAGSSRCRRAAGSSTQPSAHLLAQRRAQSGAQGAARALHHVTMRNTPAASRGMLCRCGSVAF